jgi:large subunit ribosomal protein L35
MGYKYKPSKAVKKRFTLTATGKLKRGHQFRSHLMSGRSGEMKRRMGRPAILAEGHSKNLRRYLGESGTRPNQIRHQRELAAAEAAAAE